MSTAQVAGNFTDRLLKVVSNTDQLLEGLFWGSWCGLNVFNWTRARKEKAGAFALPSDSEKAEKVWEAGKQYTLATFSLASGISMVTSWLQDVGLVALGRLAPLFGGVGYGASAVVSSSKFWDGIRELDHLNYKFTQESGPREKSRLAFSQIESLLSVAFHASLVSWGFFGALYSLQGGAALFTAMDKSLYYAVVLLGANLINMIAMPLIRKLA